MTPVNSSSLEFALALSLLLCQELSFLLVFLQHHGIIPHHILHHWLSFGSKF